MNFTLIHKQVLNNLLLLILTAISITTIFYFSGRQLLLDNALDELSREISGEAQRLNKQIDALGKDVKYLAGIPAITEGYLNRPLLPITSHSQTDHLWEQELVLVFRAMMQSNPGYLQIRLIDNSGQELVRVDRRNNNAEPIPKEKLQNKARRQYVVKTLALTQDTIHLSQISLNRENNRIMQPYTPVLRAATPVFDASQTIQGMVVINLDIGLELSQMAQQLHAKHQQLYISTGDGSYLIHPDPTKLYAADLGHKNHITQEFPALAPLLSRESENKTLTIRPDDNNAPVLVSTRLDLYPGEQFLIISLARPYDDIVSGETEALLIQVSYFIAPLAIFVILLTYLLSGFTLNPLKQITTAINEYSNKGIWHQLPLTRKDEIGQLARTFNELSQRVRRNQNELRNINNELERKIKSRTQSLEDGEKLQSAIVEHMVDGHVLINEHGQVISFNKAAESIFGYSRDEVIDKNVAILMPEPHQSAHDGYITNYQHSGEAKIIGIGREVEGKHKDGHTFPLELGVSEITLDGKRIYSGILRDISERKYIDKMKTEFISTVSHELRTPLTSIRGSLGLLTGGAIGKLPAQVMEMLNIASNNTERLLLLINDILDIQKIESGQMAFKFQHVDAVALVQDAIRDNESYGRQHGVKFVIATPNAVARIFADKDRLMQVMANLLSNAAKYSPDGETVEVSIARHHGDTVRISVTDHGPGIPEDFQPKLFDKFTQHDSSDTRQKGGTGLGLSISKVIMEKHGGLIDFISREGIGSTFYIELPEMLADYISDDTAPRQALSPHQPCVLIVEDDPDIAMLLQRVLAESGFNSDIANNTLQARKLLQQKAAQYQAITLDLALPGQSGISFVKELRTNAATLSIPVVIVSVQANEAKRDLNGGAIGIVDWLEKPIDQKRLINAIRQSTHEHGTPKVLHVEDDHDVYQVVKTMLNTHCDLSWADTLGRAQDEITQQEFDLVLLDIGLPDGSGLDLLPLLEAKAKPPKVVIFSAYEVSPKYAEKVSAALVKSQTDNTALTHTIINLINQRTSQSTTTQQYQTPEPEPMT